MSRINERGIIDRIAPRELELPPPLGSHPQPRSVAERSLPRFFRNLREISGYALLRSSLNRIRNFFRIDWQARPPKNGWAIALEGAVLLFLLTFPSGSQNLTPMPSILSTFNVQRSVSAPSNAARQQKVGIIKTKVESQSPEHHAISPAPRSPSSTNKRPAAASGSKKKTMKKKTAPQPSFREEIDPMTDALSLHY